jgi:hypothetical protein
MDRRVSLLTGPALFAIGLCLAGFAHRDDEKGFVSLFNGKDLKGWTPKIKGYKLGDNYGNTFRVEDGVLKVVYDPASYPDFKERYGHLFYKSPFKSYLLRLQYRFVGKQVPGGAGWAFKNSGVMIHGESPQEMRLDQDFPVSSEVQLLGGDTTGDRPTGNVCTPGTNIVYQSKLWTQHCTNSTSPTFRGEEWVDLEVEAHGNGQIIHRINGQTVMSYSEIQYDDKDNDGKALIKNGDKRIFGGSISLQSESHPCEFRNIRIKVLKE